MKKAVLGACFVGGAWICAVGCSSSGGSAKPPVGDANAGDAGSAVSPDGAVGSGDAATTPDVPETPEAPVPARFADFAAALETERQQFGAPGVSVAIVEHGEVTFAHGFGVKALGKPAAARATTLYRIGSCTKMMTATALLQLVAAGKVDLAQPVTTYVPAFKLAGDATWAPSILVKHLLTHASGMFDYLEVYGDAASQDDGALETYMTGGFGAVDYLMAPAGRFYNYSNPNFYLAGLVAQKVSGVPYRDLMKTKVFAPLGMTRTFFLGSEATADGDVAWGKTKDDSGKEISVGPEAYENAWARPAGYAFSSVVDLAKFTNFIMHKNAAVLPDALVDAMQTAQIDTQELGDLDAYGYGLETTKGFFLGQDFYQVKLVSHSGAIDGFSAEMDMIPALDFAFVALSNTDGAYYVDAFVKALETLTTLPAPSPAPTSLDVDPATFAKLAGGYDDPNDVGHVDVALTGGKLTISFPDLDKQKITYDPALAPETPYNFGTTLDGEPLDITFILDASGNPEYLRTRPFVAKRAAAAHAGHRAPPPFDRARFARDVRASRAAFVHSARAAVPTR